MKPGPNFPPEAAPLLAFGAHPDDVEFGCGGVVANETATGRPAHLVVCSRGESATHGTPAQRTAEAERAAALLGATLEWLELDGDAHLEIRAAHALKLAEVIRRLRPAIVLAPSLVENQHPDHARLGRLVRDAARLARYGGIAELRALLTGTPTEPAATPEAPKGKRRMSAAARKRIDRPVADDIGGGADGRKEIAATLIEGARLGVELRCRR